MERLPGFRDFYPEPLPHTDVWSADARSYIFSKWRQMAMRYGFREYDGPPLESLELFTTKSGAEIVAQLYNFQDKGGREVALRPEMTPTLARMVAAHERNYKKPIKWFAIPQLFRYERQQKGRLREHFQFNADIIGESSPAADAEIIALLVDTLRSFGLGTEDFQVRLSSRQAWAEFYKLHKGDPSREYEFYQAVDKLERESPENTRKKLESLGVSYDEVTAFLQTAKPSADLAPILENLSARGLMEFVKVDFAVIRGLAYYTGVVFEAFDRKGEFRAIAGGGRYDNLVRVISGGKVNLPALGFGMGDVVLLELLRARQKLPVFKSSLNGYCAIEDEKLYGPSLSLVQQLRDSGLHVDYSFVPGKLDKQLKRALELGASWIVWLEGGGETGPTAKLRNLHTREERRLPISGIIEAVKEFPDK